MQELINHICVKYLNDILIYFKTREKQWKCVHKMLERLCQFKLYAKLSKCFFMIQMIEFLEYIIINHDVSMNSCRVKIIQTWFEFRVLRELQIFLEFVNFYKRFVKFYAKITRVLTKLLKENKQERQYESFNFEKAARQTFWRFIKTFTKAFMLIHFNFRNLIRIKIDVSELVIAAILFQFITFVIDVNQTQWHSIVFYLKKWFLLRSDTRRMIKNSCLLSQHFNNENIILKTVIILLQFYRIITICVTSWRRSRLINVSFNKLSLSLNMILK